jgi:hypothetical protein
MEKITKNTTPQYQRVLWACWLLLSSYGAALTAQNTPSASEHIDSVRNKTLGEMLENIAQNEQQEENTTFDPTDGIEQLKILAINPLDLNTASKSDLDLLKPLLNNAQIEAILWHRNVAGNFRKLEELQAVSLLDLKTIRQILPFVRVTAQPIQSLKTEQQLWLRWARRIEKAKGYDTPNGYLGDPNQLMLRYHFQKNKNFSINFIAEKDAGEPFATQGNKTGFDFYSANIAFSLPQKKGKPRVVLGDYAINLGQGLVLFNGFALGKSAEILNIERNQQTLRPYTSVTENGFLRGAAATFEVSKRATATFFLSAKNIDANVTKPDTLPQNFIDSVVVSSFQVSGLHRTAQELADKHQTRRYTGGGAFQWLVGARTRMGVQAVAHRFDKNILPSDEPYHFYSFKGKSLWNSSINFQSSLQNIRFFGETALSGNGGWATANGAVVVLDKTLAISILQRYFDKKYHSFDANPFAESTNVSGESGILLGLNWSKGRTWKLQSYADLWQFSTWRFRVDGISEGREYFAKLTYAKKTFEAYLQWRQKMREENAFFRPDSVRQNRVIPKTREQLRVHFEQPITPFVQLAARVEWSKFSERNPFLSDGEQRSQGFLGFIDVQVATPQYISLSRARWLRRWSASARYAIFDTPDFSTAIYAYENDVLGAFSIVPYYGSGTRVYLNLKYKPNYRWIAELRWARSFFPNQTQLGSGLETITGSQKTDMRLQIRYEF